MHPSLNGLTVLERDWLSSNNLLIHGAGGEPGAALIDSSHVCHAEQTVPLVRHALRDEPLARIVNTHLHSDHCGGNAALQRAFGAPLTISARLRRRGNPGKALGRGHTSDRREHYLSTRIELQWLTHRARRRFGGEEAFEDLVELLNLCHVEQVELHEHHVTVVASSFPKQSTQVS